MGGALPGQGAPGRADRRHRAEHPHDYLYVKALCEQLWSDPGWNDGDYKSSADVVDGLKRHAHIWAVMGFSTEFWKQEVWRALEFTSKEAVHHRLPGALLHGDGPERPADDDVEVAARRRRPAQGGDLAAALGRITAKTFVMPIDEDMFFPPRDCVAEQELIPGSELRVIEDIGGHLGLFGIAPTYMPQIDRHLGELLATDVP